MNLAKFIEKRSDRFLSFIAALFFILFSMLLPIYDEINGIHNPIFSEYKLVWYDGRSPLNFHIILNLIKNGTAFFPEDYKINDFPIKWDFDLVRVGDVYKPIYNYLPLYLFTTLFYFVPFQTELQLFKLILFSNIVLSSLILALFYFIQRRLGLKKVYSLGSTLLGGIATSILIYSRYLFLTQTIYTLVFIALIYLILKNWGKKSTKGDVLISSISSLYIFILKSFWLVPIFFLYLFHRFKVIKSIAIFVAFYLVTTSLIFLHYFFLWEGSIRLDIEREGLNISHNPFFTIFPSYIAAPDYSIYGFHNLSGPRLDRYFAYIYGFREGRGNAIFLFVHGLFGSLFGPKGFVFNSPFLIFSIFGILFKEKPSRKKIHQELKRKREFILWITCFFIILGGFYFFWYGGATPRYVRHFNIPVLFLTFFSFYYLQRTKERWKELIFLILIILSVLNVSSLAIRADWTYEHASDLFSYDLVLWPFIPSIEEKHELYLMSGSEQLKWIAGGELDCKAIFSSQGIVTDPCWCAWDSWAERRIRLKGEIKEIEIQACAGVAGEDGTKGFVYVDNELLGEVLVESNSCMSKSFLVSLSPGDHLIKLKSGKHGKCEGEMVIWREISFR
jgi:hypothetical protein